MTTPTAPALAIAEQVLPCSDHDHSSGCRQVGHAGQWHGIVHAPICPARYRPAAALAIQSQMDLTAEAQERIAVLEARVKVLTEALVAVRKWDTQNTATQGLDSPNWYAFRRVMNQVRAVLRKARAAIGGK